VDEEEFRRKIDYDEPVTLKAKAEEQPSNEAIYLPVVSSFTDTLQGHGEKEEGKVKMDFSAYGRERVRDGKRKISE